MKQAHIEIYLQNEWRTLGLITLNDDIEKGYKAKTTFEYDPQYVSQYYGDSPFYAVSLKCEINFETFKFENWAPFLLDLIPQGGGRRYWENKLNLLNRASADWPVLLAGASNCAGHLRIKEAVQISPIESEGFHKEEIWKKKTKVLMELEKMGIPLGSSSSVQGDSPKFFLTEDSAGRWHPSGLLSTEKIKKEWLVKFPRSSQVADRLVLQMEERYHSIAKNFGLNVFENLFWKEDSLFIPRFDIQLEQGKVTRLGLESMASAMGISEFGSRPNHEMYLAVIKKFSTQPESDIKEYLSRDLLNVCFGNTDNHPRNTAFIKTPTTCRLSPLYDFAPMILDTEGITRVCRWSGEREKGADPEWKKIRNYLETEYEELNVDWILFFKEKRDQLEDLKNHLPEWDLEQELLVGCQNQIEIQLQGLI